MTTAYACCPTARGEQVVAEDLRIDIACWPEFAALAIEYGFLSVHALPLRLRNDQVGP